MNWLADIRWALAMIKARRIARGLMFSQRMRFFDELRPILGKETRIAWPDGMFWVSSEDVSRARTALTRSNKDD
jgi:hypothetical protein